MVNFSSHLWWKLQEGFSSTSSNRNGEHQEQKKGIVVCQTAIRPSQHPWLGGWERSSTAPYNPRAVGAVNHALVQWPCLINQTWFPVSLELKDTVVRAYRTDPVQVRSWTSSSSSVLVNAFSVLYIADEGQRECRSAVQEVELSQLSYAKINRFAFTTIMKWKQAVWC